MKVLMITGDKNFSASPRFALQAAQVERLGVVYIGWGSLWPKVPAGQFDVVTAQDPLLRGAFARRAAKKIGARFNVQVHMDLQVLPWWKHILARIILRHADSIRVVSEKIKKQVQNMGVTAPISVLPVYIDISKFRNIIHQPSKSDLLGGNILWLGRFEDEKDPLCAIEVLKKVPNARLVMLGSGSLEKKLKKSAAGLEIEFPGWQDPAAYLAEADVVLSTSKHESYGASIIEALAAGVPVVSPDIGVAREAGAAVAARPDLAHAVAEVLRSGGKGDLKIHLLNEQEWGQQWKQSLT
ncbi:hypothetical protein A3D70_02455 [Candidatus Adlerbacteria bacterium RIFCSPHIGHO2_02_FULL_54_18]|uniref:Glycosyltransferase subfamily 4-like N-terminal domain-containing protein n=1 Tax=Candidatus Adlerbacteria bacterium RIFCSPHIGHO2_02_FULL_54_18 TaxID=1797241 RepID=A0A1F4Y496_9BACT|nr:MAG: hypothetical protein A3D70_02455 [Candidatus Adlerbacteria bacterium RIFCSPHIGHO2_02_FULL_54_18]